MPLYIYERDENNQLVPEPDSQGDYKTIELELPGEISSDDFEVSLSDVAKYDLSNSWLRANFDVNVLHVDESPNFDTVKVDLAKFLNEKTIGPFYVRQGYVNTRQTLSVTLLTQKDIAAFAVKYPEWERKAPDNRNILKTWEDNGRELEDPSLYGYAAS